MTSGTKRMIFTVHDVTKTIHIRMRLKKILLFRLSHEPRIAINIKYSEKFINTSSIHFESKSIWWSIFYILSKMKSLTIVVFFVAVSALSSVSDIEIGKREKIIILYLLANHCHILSWKMKQRIGFVVLSTLFD